MAALRRILSNLRLAMDRYALFIALRLSKTFGHAAQPPLVPTYDIDLVSGRG
jgi:hypothetical protein